MSSTPKTEAFMQRPHVAHDAMWAGFACELETENIALRAQVADLTAQVTDFQSNCDHEFEPHDDSFSHEFGTEIIRFLRCEKCGKIAEWDDVDHDDSDPPERDDDEPNYDLPKPLTPLENSQRNDEHSPSL